MKFLVLDIEAIRDPAIWEPPDPDGPAILQAGIVGQNVGIQGTVSAPPRDIFAPPHGWQPIVIGCVLLEYEKGWSARRVGAIEAPAEASIEERERIVLEKFHETIGKLDEPEIVTWNGREFDLPVLMLRSLRLGLRAHWYYKRRDCRYRYSEEGHLDLQDAMSDYGSVRQRLGLDGMAKLIGLPGKFGDIDGAGVADAFAAGRLADITTYCMLDAVQTAFLLLRWDVLKGSIDLDAYRSAAAGLLALCEAEDRFKEFVGRVDRKVLLLEAEPTQKTEAA